MVVTRGDIFLVDLSNSIGSEQGGIRPAVVVQNDKGNANSATTIVCPLTSQKKNNIPTHVVLTPSDSSVEKDSIVLCEQVRVISKDRLKKKLGEVKTFERMQEINAKICISLGL